MNKVLSSSKLSASSKLVRRVLSRSSNTAEDKPEKLEKPQEKASTAKKKKKQSENASLDLEVTSLKEQVKILKVTINGMQEGYDKKEKAYAELAREKQQLAMELKREKRSSINLKKQLSDEREFYFKEKEQYCQEMNDCKKLKQKISESAKLNFSDAELVTNRKEIDKLKEALQQTLEVNYNLSVKFLRMRNTKNNIKTRLKKQEEEHKETMKNFEQQVSAIKAEITNIVEKRIQVPISPSNKRYLQTMKQHGILMHENLCLKMDIDLLTSKIEQLEAKQAQSKMDTQLKYIYNVSHKSKETKLRAPDHQQPVKLAKDSLQKVAMPKKEKKTVVVGKTTKTVKNASKKPENNSASDEVIKLFERNKSVGKPKIIFLSSCNGEGDVKQSSIEVKESEEVKVTQSEMEVDSRVSSQDYQATVSRTSSFESKDADRIQSAPEIVQTSIFFSNNKS